MSPHLLPPQNPSDVVESSGTKPDAEEGLLSCISPHFDVKKTIYGGRGCFARSDIAKGTVIHVAKHPVGSSVARVFRKEVCTGCFAYHDGKTLKHRLHDKLYFCSAECVEQFVKTDPNGILTSTLIRVETLFRQCRGEGDQNTAPESDDQMAAVWADVEQWDAQFERMKPSKRAMIRPLIDEDDYCELRYVLSVFHTMHQVDANGESLGDQLRHMSLDRTYMEDMHESTAMALETRLFHLLQSSEQQKVERYAYLAVTYANIYKFIRLVAAPEYLPYITIQNVRDIIGRNLTNAFGIWSLLDNPEEEREYFGFGVYPSASFFNHSCRPNVTKTRRGGAYEYHVNQDIDKGVELCISYGIRTCDTVDQRRAALVEWFFTCGCEQCVVEAGEA